jgi:hypothetical protein
MIRRLSKLPTYLTQAEIRALFAAISNLRDRTLFGFEFVERLRARGVPVITGHGVPHGKSIPFLPAMERCTKRRSRRR